MALAALALGLTWTAAESSASSLSFASTSDPSAWQVATNVGGLDGALSSFPTTGFTAAVGLTNRPDWIANNATGTNGCCVGNWTFFVFRQTVDLTGYDPTTADLMFQWAADDSGEGFADRGTWTPKYSVNGGSLINGVWATGSTYDYGPTTSIASGFVNGLNTIDFYVEGNGITDGMALRTVSFTASAVPDAKSWATLLAGMALLVGVGRRQGRRATLSPSPDR